MSTATRGRVQKEVYEVVVIDATSVRITGWNITTNGKRTVLNQDLEIYANFFNHLNDSSMPKTIRRED